MRILLFLALICFPAIATAQKEPEKGESTISGRVIFADTAPISNLNTLAAAYCLSRADPAVWDLLNSRIFAAIDPTGEFSLRGAPGEYLVFAWPSGGQPMQSIEEFVRSNAASARRITLQSREEKRMDLTVVKPKK